MDVSVERIGVGLLFEKLRTRTDPLDFGGGLTPLQRVPGPPPTKLFSRCLGQLRTADARALARFDLGARARNGPTGPVGDGSGQQRHGHARRRLS
jgi:hypothetical protein